MAALGPLMEKLGTTTKGVNYDVTSAVDYLRAKGLAAREGSPIADRAQASATLTSPDGTRLYLFEKGAQ